VSHNFELVVKELMPLSSTHEQKMSVETFMMNVLNQEWEIDYTIKEDHWTKCLCGVRIMEQCHIRNKKTKETAIIGNVCIEHFNEEQADVWKFSKKLVGGVKMDLVSESATHYTFKLLNRKNAILLGCNYALINVFGNSPLNESSLRIKIKKSKECVNNVAFVIGNRYKVYSRLGRTDDDKVEFVMTKYTENANLNRKLEKIRMQRKKLEERKREEDKKREEKRRQWEIEETERKRIEQLRKEEADRNAKIRTDAYAKQCEELRIVREIELEKQRLVYEKQEQKRREFWLAQANRQQENERKKRERVELENSQTNKETQDIRSKKRDELIADFDAFCNDKTNYKICMACASWDSYDVVLTNVCGIEDTLMEFWREHSLKNVNGKVALTIKRGPAETLKNIRIMLETIKH